MTTAKCKGCDARVYWAVTESGRPMLIDAKSYTLFIAVDGTIVDDGKPGGEPLKVKAVQVHASHFSTCPAAEKFRRKG